MAKHEMRIYQGDRLCIVAVVLGDGSCPAVEYMKEVRCEARFSALFERLCMFGKLRIPERMRKIQGSDVWEFKVDQGPGRRVYGCREGGVFVLTHGRDKPSDKMVIREARRARLLFEEWQRHEA